MLSNVNKDLHAIMEVRNIADDNDSRLDKLEEESAEFDRALVSGNLDAIADEGADVMIVIMITLIQRNIDPWGALCSKLDKMNIETPFRR